MTTLDKQALEKAWDAYMAAVFASHPYARFQPQTPEQREENQRFVNTAIAAYLAALPEARRAWLLRRKDASGTWLPRIHWEKPDRKISFSNSGLFDEIPVEIREVRQP